MYRIAADRASAKGDNGMSQLEELAEQIRVCPLCRLCKTRTLAVPGDGPADAKIMFVGEGPGFHEDQQGRPFVGAAGHFLEQLLASINMTRQDVFITNVVKCRPPNNRDPQPDELAACRPYLDQQIALIRPQMIVTLGRFSMQIAFPGVSISQVHGIPKKVGNIVYLPVFHPAAALHQVRFKAAIEEDFLKIPAFWPSYRAWSRRKTKIARSAHSSSACSNLGGRVSTGKLRVIPLGGLGEIGRNMMVVEYDDNLIVVDAGLMFPENDMLGIDIVIPDMTYILQRADRLRAVLVTHGHEDHIGALPYLLDKVHVPVYATRLTRGLYRGQAA